MTAMLLLPVVTGLMMGFGQFYMQKLGTSIAPGLTLVQLAFAVLSSIYLYTFLSINLVAGAAYVISLRQFSQTLAFAVVFVTMGATVLTLDVLVNRVSFSMTNLVGLVLAVAGAILVTHR